ncbi:hypothetical protein L249_6906 [Ophiocordyceps polyrhachis-furcata BCC 54312]|uniref:Uncharacterized protein n=1 Tax=Ophiocordyceps polyrhachis-furcata BCC 54312 TaxID=1330021 RepID=A0A367LLY9_9HYPO|nr:hypothetical protein L249_6906 [Ophiocordyceps polyrhachis-furcata BCC 54312]
MRLYGIRYEAKGKNRKIREDSSSSLEGLPLIRARDIRFVNRARLSAIIDDPSIEFKARLEEEERDQSKGRLKTPEGDPSYLPLLDPTPNKGETARRPINEKAAILDALYEVKYLAYGDAIALEIYDSLRLERSRDRNRTYNIAETNGQP